MLYISQLKGKSLICANGIVSFVRDSEGGLVQCGIVEVELIVQMGLFGLFIIMGLAIIALFGLLQVDPTK